MRGLRSRLRRWHVWLGWLVGLPMLFWVVSGLVMVARPIEEVRGEHLVSPPAPMKLAGPLLVPNLEGRQVRSMSLEPRADGLRWDIQFADGESRMADPATGQLLPRLGAAEASRELMARYRGSASIASVSRVDPDAPPIEFRRAMDAWRIAMTDDAHFYVDSGSGEIVARRTRWWRIYDFMWGLHIMDLEGREDTHNPWIVSLAALSLIMTLLALTLLPLTIRRKNGNGEGNGKANGSKVRPS